MPLVDAKRLYFCHICIYLLTVGFSYCVYTLFNFNFDPIVLAKAALTSLGVSFGFVLLVEKYFWKWRWFRFVAGIHVPYVHGRWAGVLRSSFSKHREDHPIILEFHQTLHHLTIWYYDVNAVTHSRLAGFCQRELGGPIIILSVYFNQPIKTNEKKLQAHSGTMELYIDPPGKRINGIYYNNPHQRSTYGHMELKFIGRTLRSQFGGGRANVDAGDRKVIAPS
jgi:hypothetical protein